MDAAELFEDIRTRLFELQVNTIDRPWTYHTDELIPYVRASMRAVRAVGIALEPTMSKAGVLSLDLSDTLGTLISAMSASRIVKGDLLMKLRDGELGVIFRTGADLIDTKTIANELRTSTGTMEDEVATLIAVALASSSQSTLSTGAYRYGDQTPYAG